MATKTILITGASRRLGLFLSENFLQAGWSVIALTRSCSTELTALAANSNLTIFELGQYEAANIQKVIDEINSQYDAIHAVVHNASAFEKDIDQFNIEIYETYFKVHMALPAQLNQGLSHLLFNQSSPGNIIHITDIFAENPDAKFALYCSTKAASENLAKAYAKKYAPGIKVNAIQPGPIQFLPSHTEDAKKSVMSETLLQYEGGFEPIFLAVNSIISNPYMTGASIKVDGGRALGR